MRVSFRKVTTAAIGVLLAGALVFTGSSSADAATIVSGNSCSASDTVGCIQGTLRDGNGNGVKGVQLTLSDATGDTATAKSNKNGQYFFGVAASGPYTLALAASSLPKGVTAAKTELTVTATLGQLQPAVFPLTGAAKGSVSTRKAPPSKALQIWYLFGQGLLLGMLLALAAIGLSLIYGTTGLSNFAHAEQMTLGGLLTAVFGVGLGLPFWLAAIIAVVISGGTGYVQDRFLWGPLRKRGLGLNQLMVVTIGLSLALEYLFQLLFGPDPKSVTTSVQLNTGPLDITPNAYIAMAISAVVLVLVGLALTRTRIGRATRAVSDNRALAAASGIDVDRIIRLVWTISMGLAGLSGLLYALVNGGIQWNTGVQLLLLIFASVTLGGLGTAFGALVGSLVIGVLVQMSSLVIPNDLKYASALLVLIIILLFRPQGILGRRERIG